MANYIKSTNFTAKDSLPTGNASKIIKGSEHDAEYDAIAVAIATKQDASGSAASLTDLPPKEGGALRQIGNTSTASTSANIAFTSGFNSSTYSAYVIMLELIRPATDGAVLQLTMSTDGGSSYVSTSTYQSYRSDIGVSLARSDNTGVASQVNLTTTVGNQTDETISGLIWLFPDRGRGVSHLVYCSAAGDLRTSESAFQLPATVNAFKFTFNSGNITSGSMTLYGVKKA